MKKILFALMSFCSIMSFADQKSFAINDFDFAAEIIPHQAMKVKKISDVLFKNEEFANFANLLEMKGLPLNESIKSITISGNYKEEPGVMMNTSINESVFLSLIHDKQPEKIISGGRNIYKYQEGAKILYASYINPTILMINPNLNVIKNGKLTDIDEEIFRKYNIKPDGKHIALLQLRHLNKLSPKQSNQNQNNPLQNITANMIEDLFLSLKETDKEKLEFSALLSFDPKTEQLVKFQVNTLFLLLSSQIAAGNQILANQMTDSFRIESLKKGLLSVKFSFDPSLVQTDKIHLPSNVKNFDPFADR